MTSSERSGLVALVTGGAAGIGRETASLFGRAGYRVAIFDRDESGAQTARDLGQGGTESLFLAGDVASVEHCARTVTAVTEAWGRLDVLVNNAGILGRRGSWDELDEAEWDRVVDVNLKGTFFMTRSAVRPMCAAGGGAVVNVASIVASRGSPWFPAYSASKAGVVALTRSLARALGRHQVRVNCICPGSISGTELSREARQGRERSREETLSLLRGIPLGAPGRPRDVAQAAFFLASPEARHITGATVSVDGGEGL